MTHTVLQAITESTTLADLLARMEASRQCHRLILNVIPLSLHTSVLPGPFAEEVWCLLINSASAVAKLKQLKPTMLHAIQMAGIPIRDIRIKRSY